MFNFTVQCFVLNVLAFLILKNRWFKSIITRKNEIRIWFYRLYTSAFRTQSSYWKVIIFVIWNSFKQVLKAPRLLFYCYDFTLFQKLVLETFLKNLFIFKDLLSYNIEYICCWMSKINIYLHLSSSLSLKKNKYLMFIWSFQNCIKCI